MPQFKVGANRDLEIEYRDQWRGDESAKRVLDLAGIGTDKPDYALAASGFLIYDASAPEDRGSYLDGFTDVFDGKLKCVSRAIEIMPGFIGKTDVPADVKSDAMAVVDHYKQQIDKHNKPTPAASVRDGRRKRLPEIAALAFGERDDRGILPKDAEKFISELKLLMEPGQVQIDVIGIVGADPDYGEQGTCDVDVIAALRAAAGAPVCVNINSPGGSWAQGVAIYNALRLYSGPVTCVVIGQACSAASLIALAGDTVLIAAAGVIMIHNAWTVAIGDKHDMQACNELLAKTDVAMTNIYCAATGRKAPDIVAMMDSQTYMFGQDAIAAGFADELLPPDRVQKTNASAKTRGTRALVEIEAGLTAAGKTRAERRRLISELSGVMPRADTDPVTPRADLAGLTADFRELRTNF